MRSSPSGRRKASGLFDVQQHTFSHVPFKDIVYSPGPGLVGTIRAAPPEALLEELSFTSRLLQEHLGVECVGLRTPFGYYRGLRDRPDLLEIVRGAGLRYITSWGRNEDNANPTPWVQPFTYAEEGYPDILELPFQFWLDVVWFDQHGYDTGPGAARGAQGRGRRDRGGRSRLRRLLPRLGRDRLGRAQGRLAAQLPPLRGRAGRRGHDVHGLLAARNGLAQGSRPPSCRGPGGGGPRHVRSAVQRDDQNAVSIRGKWGPWIGSPGAHSSSSSV